MADRELDKSRCANCSYFSEAKNVARSNLLELWVAGQVKKLKAIDSGFWQDNHQRVLYIPEEIEIPKLILRGEFKCSQKDCSAKGNIDEWWYLRSEFLRTDSRYPGMVMAVFDGLRGDHGKSDGPVDRALCRNWDPEVRLKTLMERLKKYEKGSTFWELTRKSLKEEFGIKA